MMTGAEAARRDRLFALMRRAAQLGSLLDDNLDTRDAVAVAEAKLILAEMNEV